MKNKKRFRYFDTYISKLLKFQSSDNGITNDARQQMNSVLIMLSEIMSNLALELTNMSGKKTLSHKEVHNATKILLNGDLARHALTEGEKAVESFTKMNGEDNLEKGLSRQNKAGICFPPSILEKFLRKFGNSNVMVTQLAPIYAAAVVEYICMEVLSVSSESAKSKKRVRITVQDLDVSVKRDVELNKLFQKYKIQFLGGGVVPYIHPVLLKKKKKKRKKKKSSEEEDSSGKDTVKKPHRYKPGTVSLREIKKYQKMSNVLILAKFPFEKFVREVFKDYRDNVKISKQVFGLMQYFIENYIVDILHKANLLAIHSGRVKLMPSDIDFVRSLIENKKYFFDTEYLNLVGKNSKDEDEDEDESVNSEEDLEEEEEEEEDLEEED
tara:strand:- start:97 stop:1245 length:1149 start_codon:yes stop_codon:yes gene_type:complete